MLARQSRKLCVVALVAVATAIFHLPQTLSAQADLNNGNVVGQVLDASGGAIVGAQVTVRNVGTNYSRTTATDGAGRYAVGPVPIGSYEVTVRPANLEASTQQVYVSLGGRASANFTVGVQAVRESIDVVADAPAVIEPTQTFSKAVLTAVQLRNIPAPGRRIKNLFLLTPATQIEPECGGFSISGQKGVYTSFNVDGGDYTSSHYCGHVEMTPTISVEAIQELQVLRSTFSAEYGRSTGGIVNLATRSGTNQLHGTSFYLARNESLTKVDPFKREQIGMGQQFGGSIGGPIRADRTFFFSAAEFQYNDKPLDVLYEQLDVQNLRNTPGGQTLLSVAPEQSLTSTSELQSTVNRIDHHLNDNNNLTVRFDFTRNSIMGVVGSFINTNGLGAGSVTNRDVTNASPTSNRTNFTGMVQHTSVLSPSTVNQFRYAVASEYRPWEPGDGPEVTVNNAGQTLAIYGPQGTGLSYGNVGYKFSDLRNQFVNNFSIITGAHTLRVGVDANLVNSEVRFNPGYNGVYRFDSLAGYLARDPGPTGAYSQFAGSGVTTPHKHQIAFYVQDEWRVGRGLTLSPGFRYEMALLPDYEPATLPSRRFATEPIPDDKEMFGPRMGLAWDIGQNAKTVFRAAAGVFYAPPYITLWEQAIVFNGGNPELGRTVNVNNSRANPNVVRDTFGALGLNLAEASLDSLPVFTPEQIAQLPLATQAVYFMEPDFKLARSFQYRVALEREIAQGFTATIDYTTINTTRMDRVRDTNLAPPVRDAQGRPIFSTAARPNPNFGSIYITEASARGFYRGMTASMNLRRSRFVIDGAYTLSYNKGYDEHENGGVSSPFYENAYDLNNEYSWTQIDQRHQFASSAVFFLPMGFEVSTVNRFNTGRPFSPRTGIDSNGDGTNNDRPLLNGYPVPRYTFRNKGFRDTSLRVQKSFALPNERGRITFSTEFFNLLDFDNVEIGSNQFTYCSNAAGSQNTTANCSLDRPAANLNFGRVRDSNTGEYLTNGTLRTTPFQVQLGLRFEF